MPILIMQTSSAQSVLRLLFRGRPFVFAMDITKLTETSRPAALTGTVKDENLRMASHCNKKRQNEFALNIHQVGVKIAAFLKPFARSRLTRAS